MMAYEIAKVDVWAGPIKDRPGGLAEKLDALSDAGANLEFLVARREPGKRGAGVVFLAPLKGPKQSRAAKAAGLAKTGGMHSLRVSGPDRPGLVAKVTEAASRAGVNLRGVSAAALGRKSVIYFAFDSSSDAQRTRRIIKRILDSGK